MSREGRGAKVSAWLGRLRRRPLFGRQKAAPQDMPKRPNIQQERSTGALEELMGKYEKLLQQQQGAAQQQGVVGFSGMSRRLLDEAEREATALKSRARREAEVEAARILAEAKQQAQQHLTDAHRVAREVTEKEIENILESSRKRAQIIEDRAKQGAQLFLMRAREDIQNYVGDEAKGAYYKLQASLQEVLSTAQKIDTEWKNRKVELWDATAIELEEYRSALFGTLGSGQPEVAALGVEAEVGEEERPEAVPSGVEGQGTLKVEEMEGTRPSGVVKMVEAESRADESPAPPEDERLEVPVSAAAEEKGAPTVAADVPSIYNGEVELAVAPFKDISFMPKFYSELLSIQGLKVLRTAGSWDSGTTIMVVLDQPVQLRERLLAMPNIRVLPAGEGSSHQDKSFKGQRISIVFSAPNEPRGGQPQRS